MVNEEIITALKNAIERGEPLQNAINLAINTGYNPRDVQEAASYLQGYSVNYQPRPGEQLTMPSKKSFFSKLFGGSSKQSPQKPGPNLYQPQRIQQPQPVKIQTTQNTYYQQPRTIPQPQPRPQPRPQPQPIRPMQPARPMQPTKIQQTINMQPAQQLKPQLVTLKKESEQIKREVIMPQKYQQSQSQQPTQSQQQPQPNINIEINTPKKETETIKEFPMAVPVTKQVIEVVPEKQSYIKEIILLIILIILIGVLALTIFFKGQILDFFSGL